MNGLLGSIAFLGLGLVLGWFAARMWAKGATIQDRAELSAQVAKLEATLQAEQTERSRSEAQLQTEFQKVTGLSQDLARSQEQIEQSTRRLQEQEKFLETAHKEMEDSFRALAASALQGNTKQFLELAEQKWATTKEQAAHDLDTRQKKIDALVSPLAESLKKLEAQTTEIEKERHGAYQGLLEHLHTLREATTSLRDQTTGLERALKGSQVQGRWGEVALRNIVELAGMTEHCDFSEQVQVEDGSRPDMVVTLPEGRFIALDSKAPMNAYMAAVNATDDVERQRHLKEHARALRTHVKTMASRDYASKVSGEVDLVVLFLPADPFLSAAFAEDPELQTDALRQKILIATPTTLLALLRTVAIYWEQRALADNAAHIADTARELYERAGKFGEYLDKTGKGLRSAVEAYNSAVGSFTSRVLPMGQRLEDLKAVEHAKRKLASPREVEVVPRDVPPRIP